MTNQNNAAQAAELSDAEILLLWEETSNNGDPKNNRVKFARALLSKLRAEGVPSDDEIVAVWNSMPGGPDGWLKTFGFLQFARAVLDLAPVASAPVAGEAQKPTAWLYQGCRFPSRHGYEYRDVLSATLLDHYYVSRDESYVKGEPLYAAPQASEAVRDDMGVPMPEVMHRPDWLRGYADTCELQARSRSHGTLYSTAKALRDIAAWLESSAALSAQPGAQKEEQSDA